MSDLPEPPVNATEEPELPPTSKKRKYRPPDASKRPNTITTSESVMSALGSTYDTADMAEDDIERLRNAVESIVASLIKSVVESRRVALPAEESDTNPKSTRNSRKGVIRVAAGEIWKALVVTPELHPIARRFLDMGLVPADHKDSFVHLLEDYNTNEDERSPDTPHESQEDDESDCGSDEEMNRFLVDN